jgi:hypothetical protein
MAHKYIVTQVCYTKGLFQLLTQSNNKELWKGEYLNFQSSIHNPLYTWKEE